MPVALARSLPFTTIAANAKTASRSSRTAFTPTGSAVTAFWPTPSACPVWLLLQPGQPVSSAGAPAGVALDANRDYAGSAVQNRRSRAPDRPLCSLSPRQRLALPELVPLRCLRRQQQLTPPLVPNSAFHRLSLRSRAQNHPPFASRRRIVPDKPLRLLALVPRRP